MLRLHHTEADGHARSVSQTWRSIELSRPRPECLASAHELRRASDTNDAPVRRESPLAADNAGQAYFTTVIESKTGRYASGRYKSEVRNRTPAGTNSSHGL